MTDQLRVKGRELTVKHLGEDLTFVYPPTNLGNYAGTKRVIEEEGFLPPTMAQTASLVHAAFSSEDIYSKEIKKLLEDRYLWAYTGTLTVPNKGLYIQDHPPIVNGMPNISSDDLERRVEEGELRFVPFGFKTGEMSPSELGKNPYVHALAGKEGAEKLAKVAEKYPKTPVLWALTDTDRSQTRVSVLDSYWVDDWLFVDGDCHGYVRGGCSFWVQK